MRNVIIFLLVLEVLMPSAGSHEDIPTYYMHDLCGQSINLRRESVFTAKIEFQPSALFNRTRPKDGGKSPSGISNIACALNIESWNFQNRIMIHFENVGIEDLCTNQTLRLLDGPDERSPDILVRVIWGTPRKSKYEDTRLQSSSFTTTDKDLSLRFHGNNNVDKSAVIRAVIVAFHSGTCMSYEHQCLNGHCIMQDLVCNGYNPCGDFNDCLKTLPSQGFPDNEEDTVTGFAIISASVSVALLLLVGATVIFVCYHKRQNRACHRHQREYINGSTAEHSLLATNPSNVPQSQPTYERTVSQIEAERRFAPPSYSQLPAIENEAEIKIEQPEPDPPEDESPPIEMNLDRCLEPEDNRPPSYICVMLHQEEYKLSEPNIHSQSSNRGLFTNNKPTRTHSADNIYQKT